ncbi:MAG: cytochrome c maturation protein CcmE, partial [Anaerolineales bacterium]|nr:cytochrome c maturation protein CcmE [Anaerolineales bacterium]
MSGVTTPGGGGVFSGRGKFVIGGLLIVAAIIYLIASSTQAAAQYYLTIDELAARGTSVLGRNLKTPGGRVNNRLVQHLRQAACLLNLIEIGWYVGDG